MSHTASAALSLMLAGGLLLSAPAMAQKIAATAAVEPADPLTPKTVDSPAPLAPGAPATIGKSASQADPAIAVLLERLAAMPAPRSVAEREDRAALAAFYADNGGQPVWTTADGQTPRATAALDHLARARDFGLDETTYRVTPHQPARFDSAEAQAAHEQAVGLAVLTYARHARGGRIDPTSLSRMIDRKPQPFEPKSVLAALATADDAGAALARFHPRHPEFEALRQALLAARAAQAAAETIQRLEVNLERWRWMPDDLGAFHIRNNIPEQLTRVVKDNEVVFTERIVVGKPNTPTPQMSASLQFVIFHPSWGVPDGIKSNEIGPMLRRASARSQNSLFGFDFGGGGGGQATRALERHQLRVYQGGREVNPDSIDWTRADVRQFHFTQPPSGRNVLGVVKFRFPNKYDVYMHDTQEKSLFAQNVRAYSHGCMRVQNPLKLAEVILGHDKGWTEERVRAAVAGGRTSDITLGTPVPVHLTYFTATVDAAGKLHLHGDIYGMDQRVAAALTGKPVALAAAKSDAAPKREARRPAPQSRDVAQAPFNPFSGLFGN